MFKEYAYNPSTYHVTVAGDIEVAATYITEYVESVVILNGTVTRMLFTIT